MIPASYHFNNIDRFASRHPGVEAEIAEARRRDGVATHRRPGMLKTLISRLLPATRPVHDWSHVPAE